MTTPLEASRALYDHVRRGEWAAAEAFFTEDFVIHEPASLPYGGEWRGRDALQRLYRRVMELWIEPQVEWIDLIGGEAHTVALLRFAMTSPVTGRRMTQMVAEVTEFAEPLGDPPLMRAMRIHYFDTAELAASLRR